MAVTSLLLEDVAMKQKAPGVNELVVEPRHPVDAATTLELATQRP